jgi:hypothetical protein
VARPGGCGGSTIDSAAQLRARLRGLGLADPAIEAAWPRWWSADAEASASARAELRFGVARRLGLDPGSLLDDAEQPRFLWREEARFKHLSTESEVERAGIASFGRAVATAVAAAAPETTLSVAGSTAQELREQLLAHGRPFVALDDLVALSWGVGVPVVHLRVFPWPQKRMAAMTVRIGNRHFILLGKDALYPAWIAFYLAHELAHIALAHLQGIEAVVDLDREGLEADDHDDEEQGADTWALELLTGRPHPTVDSVDDTRSAAELARVALASGPQLGIEPGTLALLFGHTTSEWAVANASLKRIYATQSPVWRAINAYARQQLHLDEAPSDTADFVSEVLKLDDLV